MERLGSTNLIHYTSAEAACKILQNKRFWLRDARMMNDVSEILHGAELVDRAFFEDSSLSQALEDIFPHIQKRIYGHTGLVTALLRRQTFIGCLAEHSAEEGKLSMWRAYGGEHGVGLVFNAKRMFEQPPSLGIYSAPVLYWDSNRLASEFDDLALWVEAHKVELAQMGVDAVSSAIVDCFARYAICLKHKAFAEEREWRVFCLPVQSPGVSTEAVQTIKGVPQIVREIGLNEYPELGIDVTIENILKEVIIGPSKDSDILWDAFNGLCQPKNLTRIVPVRTAYVPLRR